MQNKFTSELVSMCVFVCMFMLSVSYANMFFMAIAMFALSSAFKRIASRVGFIFFLLGAGFLFSSIVSPIFNAMAGTYSYSYINTPFGF